jgi:hypothetical protein
MVTEFSLTFPVKILQLEEPSGAINKDLIVMRQAIGMQIPQYMWTSFYSGRSAELPSIFYEFGKFLNAIHSTYRVDDRSMQHGDCQPSNVFYDESTGVFTLVDTADFGFGPYLVQGGEDDVQYFVDGLENLAPWYGKALMEDCVLFFRMGYYTDRDDLTPRHSAAYLDTICEQLSAVGHGTDSFSPSIRDLARDL